MYGTVQEKNALNQQLFHNGRRMLNDQATLNSGAIPVQAAVAQIQNNPLLIPGRTGYFNTGSTVVKVCRPNSSPYL